MAQRPLAGAILFALAAVAALYAIVALPWGFAAEAMCRGWCGHDAVAVVTAGSLTLGAGLLAGLALSLGLERSGMRRLALAIAVLGGGFAAWLIVATVFADRIVGWPRTLAIALCALTLATVGSGLLRARPRPHG